MKSPRPFNKKTIIFRFYNSFDNDFLGSIPYVYNRFDATNGRYSKIYRKWKLFFANEDKIDKRFVKAKITFN